MTSREAPARDLLTEAEAAGRARRVSAAQYAIDIALTARAETYLGDVTIAFDLAGDGPLALDFRGRRIVSLEVNGRALQPAWDGARLTLPAEALAPRTTLRVRYENAYDHGGDGFHQFFDPEDGEEYLYTTFEPFFAHRLFPCFDQPDIKARYRVSVTAPAAWEVIANAPATASEALADGRVRHAFAEIGPLSAYLVAIAAGPYATVRAEYDGIPLGLACRMSLAPFLDAEELFAFTRQGLDFFRAFFDSPYPFGKYDQVFVPEFNGAAMENPGVVTHNEAYVFRDPPTRNQRRRRAEILLHEMAHMWFGNLVTMRWWDDLWLSEAFATTMAYLAMGRATPYTAGWLDFHVRWKSWAYRQDEGPTAHPVCGPVRDTDETFLNFDGITYGKGAGVLRQLVATIGEDAFRDGVRRYLRAHAWGNATLADFLRAMEAAGGRPLEDWAHLWLETSSLNTLAAACEAEDGRLTGLTLSQRSAGGAPLRPHALEVAVLRDQGEWLEIRALPARIAGPVAEVPGAAGLPRPHLVYPNHGDHAYAAVSLDRVSLAWMRRNLDRVQDDLLRLLLWSSAWQMVRAREMPAPDYLAMVGEMTPREPLPEVLEPVLGQAALALARYLPEEQRVAATQRLFATAWAATRRAADDDTRILWARALIQVASAPADVALLGRLADGIEKVPGLVVDQQMRWAIATAFVAHGLPGGEERVTREATRDPSDRGERARLAAEAARPDPAAKAAAWERIAGAGYGTLKRTAAAMSGFVQPNQGALLEPYADRFFAEVPAVAREREHQFLSDYVANLFPWYRVEWDTLERSRQLLAGQGGRDPLLARLLREANDELERAIRCRELAASAGASARPGPTEAD